jgi:hypothetical protein
MTFLPLAAAAGVSAALSIASVLAGIVVANRLSDAERSSLLEKGSLNAQLILLEEDFAQACDEIKRLGIESSKMAELLVAEYQKYRSRCELVRGLLLPARVASGAIDAPKLALP